MNTLKHQTGMGFLGIFIMLALVSFFFMVVLRLAPAYMDGRAVKQAIEAVAAQANAQQSLGEVTKRITASFNTNRIEAIDPRDIKVYRDKGKIVIDANYETRTPLFDGVDAVLMFQDNVVVID